jgi:Uma2 family endonuclease
METQKSDKIWTYDDLPSLPDDGKRYEIFDGELVVSPSPLLRHQRALSNLNDVLRRELHHKRIAEVLCAPLDVILSPTKVVVPDIVVVRWERRSIFSKRAAEAAPDLVIEVLSPSNRKHDRVRKRRFYARNEIPEYWIVDPEEQTIEVLELVAGPRSYRQHGWYGPGDRARSATFALEVDVDALFADDV